MTTWTSRSFRSATIHTHLEQSIMDNPDPGSGTDPVGDRNLRPRRTSTTRTFFDPSPSANSSKHTRPAPISQVNTHYYTRTASGSLPPGQGAESVKDESDSSSEGELGLQEVSKLEVKREKNRLKQRNLRQRRANHISQLEDQVRHLKRDCTTFRDHITTKSTIVTANDTKYRSWISGLETALIRRGLGDEVEGLRQAWASAIQPIPPFAHSSSRQIKGSKKGKTVVKMEPLDLELNGPLGEQVSRIDTSRRGSLSTLVQAAIAVDSTRVTPSPGYSMKPPINQQVTYASHGYQHPPTNQYMRGPVPTDSTNTHPSSSSTVTPRVSTIYPGSMEALRQPLSPSRYPYRSRTIPSSARPTWQVNESRPQHPNLPPPEPEDRKRKRSLSGPTLHSGTFQSLPPIFAHSVPSSGHVDQSRSMTAQGEPPHALLPPATRPTSSHQVGRSAPSTWNTLAPFRLPAMSTQPITPSNQYQPIHSSIVQSSPQHIKISDLLMDKPGVSGEDRHVPIPMEGTPKSHSWPLPAGRAASGAMPISDLLMSSKDNVPQAGSSTEDTPTHSFDSIHRPYNHNH